MRAIVKDYGIARVCKHICDEGSTGVSEHDLVRSSPSMRKPRIAGLSPAQAFEKAFTAPTEDSATLRKAVEIAKASIFEVVLGPGMMPLKVGGEDVNPDDPEAALEAIEELHEIGRKRWPDLSRDQQFTNAFTDPKNAELAAKAHRRPSATTSFPFPRG